MLYDSLLDDPKVQQLPVRLFRLYINCLCLANKGKPRGTMGTTVEVAFRLRLPLAVAERDLHELRARNLLELSEVQVWSPHGWASRQFRCDDEAEKKRRQRKHLPGNVPGHVHPMSPATDTELDIDTDPDTEKSITARSDAVASSEQVVMTVPLAGGAEHAITSTHLAELSRLYPGVDPEQELRKAKGWLIANPTRRKTPRGIARFLHGWLGRAQDRCRGNGHGPTPAERARTAIDQAFREMQEGEVL